MSDSESKNLWWGRAKPKSGETDAPRTQNNPANKNEPHQNGKSNGSHKPQEPEKKSETPAAATSQKPAPTPGSSAPASNPTPVAPKQEALTTKTPNPQESTSSSKTMKTSTSNTDAEAFIPTGMEIEGTVKTDRPLTINGKLTGRVESTSLIQIGETGDVNADVECERIEVYGSVNGELVANEHISLHKGGKLTGKITTTNLETESGAFFKGTVEMLNDSGGKKPSTTGSSSSSSSKSSSSSTESATATTGSLNY